MRTLILLLIVMLMVLQYRLWVGEGSLAELYLLKEDIELQKAELQLMRRRNQALQAEVNDLKKGLEAIEERARNDLGMIREGEIFYQIIESDKRARK
ncbi:MAG: cell division protein FtsB [Sedimenticola selenatireducens]|uniref:Cell division protein FtsB n=1 Tax=Sedimenticola selenatireducens TaxID=191960 RepID=A0A557SG07_9GAMM|nr:cell division protein FtsB [Sedimenticola selenatireducens]TVO76339.1 cell division protein FtsB [Sedimenticola selenatireducens]TVT61449.1 MAG: cell division protein FtsB [Sedimenticola selenatireducens]